MNLDLSVLENKPFLGFLITISDLKKAFIASISKSFEVEELEKDNKISVTCINDSIRFCVVNIKSKQGQFFSRVEFQLTFSQLLEIIFQQIFKREEASDSYNKNIYDNLCLNPVYSSNEIFKGFYVMLDSTDITPQVQPTLKDNRRVFYIPYNFNTFSFRTSVF